MNIKIRYLIILNIIIFMFIFNMNTHFLILIITSLLPVVEVIEPDIIDFNFIKDNNHNNIYFYLSLFIICFGIINHIIILEHEKIEILNNLIEMENQLNLQNDRIDNIVNLIDSFI